MDVVVNNAHFLIEIIRDRNRHVVYLVSLMSAYFFIYLKYVLIIAIMILMIFEESVQC